MILKEIKKEKTSLLKGDIDPTWDVEFFLEKRLTFWPIRVANMLVLLTVSPLNHT